uniref:Provisional ortholog of NFKB inhibitor zeta n=1 Tax=Xenopus tropicalis TaxID=8364 RepID=A0A6I8S886_XENTR
MIVERFTEDWTDLQDQDLSMMSSPMNLAYFYAGSPVSDSCGSSPIHYYSSSAPSSPGSDTEVPGSLNASWPHTKKAGHLVGGCQHKGTFKGVRVKNSVRGLLMQLRSKTVQERTNDIQKLQNEMSCEQYTELKTILSKKRTYDFPLDGPVTKKKCSFQPSLFLTPPSTPKSNENMDDVTKSDTDLLQSLINIKNESKPVSLNTVQVSWLENVPQFDSTQETLYQDVTESHSFPLSQAFQACSPPQISEPCLFPLQNPDVPLQFTNSEYNFQDSTAVVDANQSYVRFPNEEFSDFQIQSLMSLLVGPELSPEVIPSVKSSLPAQNYCPTHVPPQMFIPDRNNSNSFQMGKTFFQWQIEQEDKKMANVTQEQLLFKDPDGDTYLHICVAHGRRALCYVIAQKMAALNMLDIKERNNQSALQVAVAANQHLIVQDLINLGAQVNTIDYWGRTPLHVCAEKGYPHVLQAIQKGASESNQHLDVEEKNYEGLTALHCAVIAHNAVVQQLQKNMQDRTPETEELLLKNKAMVDTVKMLLQMGASVEAKDTKSGRTALHLAAEEANLELLGLFLELPRTLAFINEKAYNGNTALHVAASLQYRKTHLGAVRLLMRKGADPSARNLENEQPVHLVPDGPVGEEIRRVLKGKSAQHRASLY